MDSIMAPPGRDGPFSSEGQSLAVTGFERECVHITESGLTKQQQQQNHWIKVIQSCPGLRYQGVWA